MSKLILYLLLDDEDVQSLYPVKDTIRRIYQIFPADSVADLNIIHRIKGSKIERDQIMKASILLAGAVSDLERNKYIIPGEMKTKYLEELQAGYDLFSGWLDRFPVQPYRLGDFIEFFGRDAERISAALKITLTYRTRDERQTKMAGVPFHAWLTYEQHLILKRIHCLEPLTELPEELK